MNKLSKIIAIGTLAGVLVSLAISIYSWFSIPKIAYVDTGILISKVNLIIATREEAAKERKLLSARVDTLVVEFEVELKKFEKEMGKMSEKEKQLSRELLKNKQKQLQDFQQATIRKGSDDENKKMNVIMSKVNSFIADFGKRNGYSVILGTTNGNIAYAKDALNITDQIVEGINKSDLR